MMRCIIKGLIPRWEKLRRGSNNFFPTPLCTVAENDSLMNIFHTHPLQFRVNNAAFSYLLKGLKVSFQDEL